MNQAFGKANVAVSTASPPASFLLAAAAPVTTDQDRAKYSPGALYIPIKHPSGLATRINIYKQGYYSIFGITTLDRNDHLGRDFEENKFEESKFEESNSEDPHSENYCFVDCCMKDNYF